MQKFISIIVLLLVQNLAFSQVPNGVSGKTNFYFVRHAEKETGNDPVLTENGKKRAGDLMRTLKNKNVKRIYVTQYKRTQMTADSMRLQLGIDTVHYIADTVCNDLLQKIKDHGDFNKTILIIGHSNTIPKIILKFGVENYPGENIPDNEFDNLFLIKYKKHHARLAKIKYGASSQASALMK